MNTETAKTAADWAAGGITVAVLVQWLPPTAAAATLIYTLLRVPETKLFRKILGIVCAKCAAWWES